MVTLVGTQTHFFDALKDLLELEYDAYEAYTAAIDRLQDDRYRDQLTNFRKDHERHIGEIRKLLHEKNVQFKDGPCGKQILMIGNIAISTLMGDHSVLKAMLSVEEDSNTAYDRMLNHKELMSDTKELMKKAKEDEKRHKEWIEEQVRGH